MKCSRAAHHHGRGTDATLSALPPRQGLELGGACRSSRPCCLPVGSVEAFATRSAIAPKELENRLVHSGGAHDLRWELLGCSADIGQDDEYQGAHTGTFDLTDNLKILRPKFGEMVKLNAHTLDRAPDTCCT